MQKPTSRQAILLSISAIISSFLQLWLGPILDKLFVTSPKFYYRIPLFIIPFLIFWFLLRWFFGFTERGERTVTVWRRALYAYVVLRSILEGEYVKISLSEVVDRGTEDYRQNMSEQIKESNKIYLLLLSAYTMFYDPREQFIINELRNLGRNQIEKKEIKILLLEKDSPYFKERGEWFVAKMKRERVSYRTIDYREYYDKCVEIEKELLKFTEGVEKASLKFYDTNPIWRLHIFDNEIYISTYVRDREGHETPLVRFERVDPLYPGQNNPLYTGFLQCFESLYEAGSPFAKNGSRTSLIASAVSMENEKNRFMIMNAKYGSNEHQVDVTGQLIKLIFADRITIKASNELAGDPYPGTKKKLTIKYRSFGKVYQVEVPEGEIITLPESG